jgi:RNA polymerase sigma-70 factor (ECF subfamily)
MSEETHADLEKHRSYLKILADMDLNPRLRAKEAVSDVVQLTLMQAHQDFAGFRGSTEAELRAWLKVILSNKLINLAKRYTAQKRDIRREISLDRRLQESAAKIVAEPAADQTTPSQQTMRQERAEQLADAMANLLEDARTALILKHVHGWKVIEIAEHLGRSPDAVAGLLRRGLKTLRRTMQDPPSVG